MEEHQPIRISLQQKGAYAFEVQFHDTDLPTLLTDEPEPLGKGTGPNPSALLLTSIANCLSASLVFALQKYKNPTDNLRADITASVERNDAGRLRIPRAEVVISLSQPSADYDKLERILAQFENFCTVTASVKDGIDVNVTVKDGNGEVIHG